LTVTNVAPTITGSLPDVTLEAGTNYTFDIDNSLTVSDSDDTLASLLWSVTGNTNVLVSIDQTTHVVTITAPAGWNGTNNLIFTVTDPSGDSDSDTITVTVVAAGTAISSDDEEERVMNVKDINVESFGNGMMMIRNNGGDFEDVRLEVSIEDKNAPENTFRFDINSNTVKYFDLDLAGLESGDYLAHVEISSEDTEESSYIFLYV